MGRNLDEWLAYQQRVHPRSIDMGLERVRTVAQALGLGRPAPCVISVAGTNGKGSTVAFIEACARAAGLKVGAYTSPHLWHYRERIRIDGANPDDAAICAAFERIDRARGLTTLTFFEFGTLAALLLFEAAALDLVILEVGLGGRLDATNIVDADVAVITTIDLDHQEYLGNDREAIGGEKAGILRAGRPCVLAEKDPPSSVLRRAYELGAPAARGHSDYLVEREREHWRWREPGYEIELPYPALAAPAQLDNAAAAVAALRASGLAIDDDALRAGIARARIPGRLQQVATAPDVVLDVAHNRQSAAQLASWLAAQRKPTRAVFSALADKDIGAIVAAVAPFIDAWYLGPIEDAGPRSMAVAELQEKLRAALPEATLFALPSLPEALRAALASADEDERVLVFGSFHTVAGAWKPSD